MKRRPVFFFLSIRFVIAELLPFSFLARLHEVQKSYCSHPGRTHSRSRSTLLKFSRSLYLDNQLSESIHTWTIGTHRVSFHSMTSDPRVHAGGWG